VLELQAIVEFFQAYGYVAVFSVLLACGLGVPIPEDISLVAGGIISGLGYTHVHTMFAVGMAGVLVGDGFMFIAGRIYGVRVFRTPVLRRIITESRYDKVGEKFHKYGKWILFAARFMPGLRSVVFISAGMTRRVTFTRFLATDGLAALISVPVWVYLGYFGANNLDWLMSWVHRIQTCILAQLAAAVVVIGLVVAVKMRRKRLRIKRDPGIVLHGTEPVDPDLK
jgi:membrane protein DedA with SNARE-associated domain